MENATIGVELEGSDRKLYPIAKDCVTIGRSSKNDIQVRSASVSRFHAKIVHTAVGFKIVNTDSKNGIEVNEEPVGEKYLSDQDRVALGHARLVFSLPAPTPDDIETRQVAMADAPSRPIHRERRPALIRNTESSSSWLALTALAISVMALVISLAYGFRDRQPPPRDDGAAFLNSLRQELDEYEQQNRGRLDAFFAQMRERIALVVEENKALRKQIEREPTPPARSK